MLPNITVRRSGSQWQVLADARIIAHGFRTKRAATCVAAYWRGFYLGKAEIDPNWIDARRRDDHDNMLVDRARDEE